MIRVVNRRKIGVNFNKNQEAEVLVWAPEKEKVQLITVDARIQLEKKDRGYWFTQTDKLKPGDRYSFIINDGKHLPDPASLSQKEAVSEFSVAVDLSVFSTSPINWKNIPLSEYILYELHTGTYTPQGTFSALETKLEYLKELGITAIEIMPVAQFSGTRNWGYDGVFPFAVQDNYGGAKGFKHLIDACHSAGLAVVLDVVYNHLGPEGNILPQFGPYFTDKYKTPWGQAINFDDTWCDGVREYVVENVLMWFRDFGVDALRFDAVHAIYDFSALHIFEEIRIAVDELMKQTGKIHYLIIESDLNNPRYIREREKGGYGMDAQWIDEFHHALRVTAGQERHGYYADFNGISHLAKAYKDAYVYDGIYSSERKRTFGQKADNPGSQFVIFSQNHDQVGNRMLGERSSALVSFEMQKLMAAAVMVSPYIPLLFMGEEWGETNPFLYFVSHSDPDLAEAVRKGRKAEFTEFHAQGEAPDPMAVETFDNSKLQWELKNKEPHKTLLAYYKNLIHLRTSFPGLSHLERENVELSILEKEAVLILKRSHSDTGCYCLLNFLKQKQQLEFPGKGGNCQKKFDSASPKWKGPAEAPPEIREGEKITIQAESIIIYSFGV